MSEPPPHRYVSTACQHGLHERCRRTCKFCGQGCLCSCGHPDAAPEQAMPPALAPLSSRSRVEDVRHADDVPWHEAPIPARLHRCRVQTSGWLGLEQVLRCACGAISSNRSPRWRERNSRRRS